IGTATLNGNFADFSISTLGIGTHSITAFYPGDSNYGPSTSAILTQIVTPAIDDVPISPIPSNTPATQPSQTTVTSRGNDAPIENVWQQTLQPVQPSVQALLTPGGSSVTNQNLANITTASFVPV